MALVVQELAPVARVELKGMCFRSWFRALEEMLGPEALEHVLSELDTLAPESAHLARSGLYLSGAWYPIADYEIILEAARRALPQVAHLHHDVSYKSVEDDLKGIYAFLIGLCGAHLVLRNQHRVVSTFVRGAYKFEVTQPSPGRYDVSMGNIFRTRLGWVDFCAGIEAFVAATGRKDVRMRVTHGGRDGDTECALAVYFSNAELDSGAASAP